MNIRNKIKIKADKYINAESLNKYIKSDALNKYILKPDSINSTFTTARAITAAFSNQKKKISTHLQHQQLPNLLKYTPKTIPKRPIYIILILLRIIYALLPAYIHPNEYYERTQLTDADKFLEPKSQQVLEFEKENPCNSIVPATLAIGIPFGFVKHIFNKIMDTELENYVNDSTLFIVYRLYFLALTFIIDICIYNIRSLQSRDPFQPLLLFSSSYLILTFYQRPFSNTLEEILLALSLWTFVACVPPRQANLRERKIKGSGASRRAIGNIQLNGFRAFFLGFFFVLGIFSRLSYALYALPILIAYLYMCYNRQAPNMFTKFMNGMYEIMPLAFGLVVTSIVFIIVDSLYFGSLNIVYNGKHEVTLENVMEVLNAPEKIASVRFTGQLIITPLNNFIKNLSVRVEPNCMNLFVNMPILYGPLYFLGIYYTIQSVSKATLRSRDLNKTVSIYCILMGLVGLTIVPQAETKYLESMGVFMVLALADKISYFVGKEKIIFLTVYVLFNVSLTLIYILIHHGGIVPNTPTVQINDFLNIIDIVETFF
jgi:phosphatidylinositol glycan class Z